MKRAYLHIALAIVVTAAASFATNAQDAPFIGVVTENTVEVRSGAGRAYYVVGELKKGDMARVEKVLFNQTWYQVRVPEGIHSYVSKVFVNAQGDGETGTINADRTEFKAASLRGPGESYRVQGTLSKGDTVTILAEEGNFYKINAPKDAFVFVPVGTLRKATAADLEAASDEEPKDTDAQDNADDKPEKPDTPKTTDEPVPPVKPVPPVTPDTTPDTTPDNPDTTPETTDEPATPETTDTPDTPATPQTPSTPDTPTIPAPPSTDGWPKAPNVTVETPARSEALKALEMKLLPYFSLPVDKQPLDQMAKAYQNIQAYDLPNIDEQIVDVRLRLIERRQQIVSTMERAKAAEKNTQARTVVPDKKDLEPLPDRFTAVGLLMPSTVYDGGSLPLLYRVVDASTSGRTLAYVAPNDEVNVGAMLNKLVGIVGKTTYDQALKLNVIQIERAVLLEAEAAKEIAEEAAEDPSEEAEDNAEDEAPADDASSE